MVVRMHTNWKESPYIKTNKVAMRGVNGWIYGCIICLSIFKVTIKPLKTRLLLLVSSSFVFLSLTSYPHLVHWTHLLSHSLMSAHNYAMGNRRSAAENSRRLSRRLMLSEKRCRYAYPAAGACARCLARSPCALATKVRVGELLEQSCVKAC